MTKGVVMLNTGNGKGKTTAAIGTLVRAPGHGMRVRMFQFIKTQGFRSGEHLVSERVGIPIETLGDGCTINKTETTLSRQLACEQWERAKTSILSGNEDVIGLDEITFPIRFGWIPVQEVIDTLKKRPAALHVVITGRDAPQELVEHADMVMEMQSVKHHYQDQGVNAQPGIEF